MKKVLFEYTGSLDKKATACLHLDAGHDNLIVFCHGFKSFMDWGTFELIGDYFCQRGFNFLRFNYTHNGTTPETPIEFTDLEAFGQNNFEKELFDTQAVLQKVSSHISIKNPSLFLMGHSKGGATALAYSLENTKIKSCATLAAVLDPIKQYGNTSDLKWKKEGVKYILNGRTNQNMPLYFQFPINTLAIQKRLKLVDLLKKDERDFLIVHGREDETIPFSETDVVNNLNHVEVMALEGANHTFGAKHPYLDSDLPEPTIRALNHIIEFFKRQY